MENVWVPPTWVVGLLLVGVAFYAFVVSVLWREAAHALRCCRENADKAERRRIHLWEALAFLRNEACGSAGVERLPGLLTPYDLGWRGLGRPAGGLRRAIVRADELLTCADDPAPERQAPYAPRPPRLFVDGVEVVDHIG